MIMGELDALYDAAIGRDADAIAKLEKEADQINQDQETILHVESQKGNTEHVRFILRQFANKNLLVKLDKFKGTALTWAAYHGHTQVAELLIDAARHLPPSANDNPVTSFQAFLRQADKFEDTALHVAVKNSYDSIVKLLVEADPTDTHNQNRRGKTPMFIAVERGLNTIVEIISTTCTAPSLDGPHGSAAVRVKNLNQDKSSGGTLYKIMDKDDRVCAAAISGDAVVIAKLELEADTLNKDGETILHVQSRKGNTEHVRFILRQFANKNLLAKVTYHKQTALHLAIYCRHNEVAELLIDAARHLPNDDTQAFLRQADKNMDTALHLAVMGRNVAMVKLLVEADPTDRHIQNNEGKTPMYIAVEQGFNDILEIISTTCTAPSLDGPHGSTAMRIKNLDRGKSHGGTLYKIIDGYALYMAAIAGDADAIAELEMQADIINEGEETVLDAESQNRYADRVEFILREFARKHLLVKINYKNQTALHLAADAGHTEAAAILIDAASHLPPSSSASDNTHDNMVTSFQAFLRQGDIHKNTALHAAVGKRNVDIVKLLVEADPSDTHTQNYDGKTPIYIAVEKGYYDIVKMICTTCTAPLNLDAPDVRTTVLHILIKDLDKGRKEVTDVIRIIIEAVKRANDYGDVGESDERLMQFFDRTDEKRCMILELAVERNYLDVVQLILAEHPAYGPFRSGYNQQNYRALIGIMPLIYKAMEEEYNDMVNLLTQTYQSGLLSTARHDFNGNMHDLINAITNRKEESVFTMLYVRRGYNTEYLVKFADNLGWTALHHAAYHEFDSIIDALISGQNEYDHSFVYQENVSTPFQVAAEKGYTSTVLRLMELWPSSSSAYTAVGRNGKNILHLAALQSNKEMIQGILKFCREEYKNKFVNEQDDNGNTPLHLLISHGCFVPELLTYEGLDIRVENEKGWTAPDMLYFRDEIIGDQVQIRIALDGIQIEPTRVIFSSSVPPSKRMRKDVILNKEAKRMKNEKYAVIKKDAYAMANCFAEAIAGDLISRAALEMEAATPNTAGETILHVEAKKGDIENVRFIVSEFVNKSLLGKLDSSKQTALHLAAHHGHSQVVKVLVDAARRYTLSSIQDFIRQANDQRGNTALHLAVLNGNVEIVKLLVEADPNDSHVQNNEGKTPIYIAAENGYEDIIKEICRTCTALSLDGPSGRTTSLHALIQNTGQVTEGARETIRMMVDAAKGWNNAEDPSLVKFKALFSKRDESGSTVLQLAVDKNFVEAVKLILLEDPAYQPGPQIKRNSLMCLICKAIDNEYNNEMINLLSKAYQAEIHPDHKDMLHLILAIKEHNKDLVSGFLKDAKHLVSFEDDNGWTPLHYAVYHEFDSVLDTIIKAQKDVRHPFVYRNMVSTPFNVAVEYGYASTLVQLMKLWPDLSSATEEASESPYTAIDKNDRNILHLAAAAKRKEMVQDIWKYCPKKYKDKILKQKDENGDTPLHLLISNGCFIPKLIKYEGLDTKTKNKKDFTPRDMLYVEDNIVEDQVDIKIAFDKLQNDQSAWKLWGNRADKKTDIWTCNKIHTSKRLKKDVKFEVKKENMKKEKHEKRKTKLERYKMRTNTQIIVTALITTVTFTVGFTMPGGLHQSGEKNVSEEDIEGLVVLSRKKAFNVFMISDALALLMSTSSLFFYFLESMNEDPRQVSLLNASSAVLNILSIMGMMLTFIAGTYVVLSDRPVLAIAICVIGSLFFLLILILWIMKIVYDRHVKEDKD